MLYFKVIRSHSSDWVDAALNFSISRFLIVAIAVIIDFVILLPYAVFEVCFGDRKLKLQREFLESLQNEDAETFKKSAELLGIEILKIEKDSPIISIPNKIISACRGKPEIFGRFLGSVIHIFSEGQVEKVNYDLLALDLLTYQAFNNNELSCKAMSQRHPIIFQKLLEAITKIETTKKENKQQGSRKRKGDKKLCRELRAWGINPKGVVTIFK